MNLYLPRVMRIASVLYALLLVCQPGLVTAQGLSQQATVLTVPAQIALPPGNGQTVSVRLTTTQGVALAGARLVLNADAMTTLYAQTDRNGDAVFMLPAAMPKGDHVLRIVFPGSPQFAAAIAVATLHYHTASLVDSVVTTGVATTAPPVIAAATTMPAVTIADAPAPAVATATPLVSPTTADDRTAANTSGADNLHVAQVSALSHHLDAAPAAPTAADQSSRQVSERIAATIISPIQGAQMIALLAPRLDFLGAAWGGKGVFAAGIVLLLGLAVARPLVYRGQWRIGSAGKGFGLADKVSIVATRLTRSLVIPLRVWYIIRIFSVGIALAVALVLVVRPALGLFVFWRLLIPVLPLLFFIAPGLWRNICPMAALNQTPRLFHFAQVWTLPKWMQRYGYLAAIGLFLSLASSRKVIFNQNGPALAVLILLALGAAFVMGNFFKGKSGWCSSICPLLPIQRIYGQTPFVNVTHAHCQPCLGCTKNCFDLSPQNAYLADLHDDDRQFATMRKAFVGLFPGFVLAFYLLPNPPAIPIWAMYGGMALICAVFMGSFFVVEWLAKTLTNASSNKITVLYGALALNLYYWFNAPALGALFGTPAPDWFVWPLRTVVLGLTLFWIARTYRKERTFIELTLAPSSIHAVAPQSTVKRTPTVNGAGAALDRDPEITVEPEGARISAPKNRTLLEAIESANLPIETGCRMGLCGADPVCIHHGMENLSKVGSDERTTLERLALAPNTRLACMARVRGDVTVGLAPEKPDIYRSSIVAGFRHDAAVQRVVIIGNGIAGVTAADHVRRRHPHCEIHLIGRERHHLYNRMGITRLIYGRSAMQGLYLLPDQWYDDFNVTCWLNTYATAIDRAAGAVRLGTGEILPYDRLIITTGSQSYVPPVAAFGLPGSFVLRTADDAMAIRSYVQEQQCQEAVVAGGGLLGLEAAYGLHKLGLNVTVLERSQALLSRQLDARSGEFLRAYLEELGIHVLMTAEAAAVAPSADARGGMSAVTLKDGRTLSTDLLLVAAGIRADMELACAAGLTVKQGVVVDEAMRTSDPKIFAAGDVADFGDRIYGLWPVAVSQAEVAAANAVAEPGVIAATYTEAPPVTMLKVAGIDVMSIGRIKPAADDMTIALEESAAHRYRKLILAGGRIVGAILLGYPQAAPGVTEAVKQQVDLSAHLQALQAGDWAALHTLA